MVVGTFGLKNNLIRNIQVNLYSNDKRIDSLTVSGNEEFGFYLRRNTIYILEIVKDGFTRKTIEVSTDLPDEVAVKNYFTFGFTLPLLKKLAEDENKYVKYISELPTAFIFYNEEIKKFDSSKDYTKALKVRYNKARQAAKSGTTY